jgi:large subunit ribosomal protein L10
MKMLKAEKERIVAELAERLRSTQTLIVADYRGLTMTEIDDLRTKLLEHGAKFSVVKNTLTRRAAEAAGTEPLLAMLDGPTAIAFLESDGDPIAVAKALSDSARTTRVLTVKGGILDGRPISDAEVSTLAALPASDTLRAQLAGALVGPLTMVVGLFAAPLRDLAGILDARIRQLEEQGEGAVSETVSETPEPAAEVEAEAETVSEAVSETVSETPEPVAEVEAEADPIVDEPNELEAGEES